MTSHCITWHDTTQAITSHQMTWPSHDLTPQQTSRHQNTSLQWSGRRLVHSKEMIWASRWSVALRTFYRQILSVLYSSFPFGNFRPRLVRALLVYNRPKTFGVFLEFFFVFNHLEERNASGFDAPKAAFAPLRWAKLRPDELRWVGPLSSERKKKKQLDGWKNVDRSLDKVDGSEIRRSPVEVGSCCLYLQGFSTIPDGAGFLPSTINSITRSWNRPSIWYTYVCFQLDDCSLFTNGKWLEIIISIHSKKKLVGFRVPSLSSWWLNHLRFGSSSH